MLPVTQHLGRRASSSCVQVMPGQPPERTYFGKLQDTPSWLLLRCWRGEWLASWWGSGEG